MLYSITYRLTKEAADKLIVKNPEHTFTVSDKGFCDALLTFLNEVKDVESVERIQIFQDCYTEVIILNADKELATELITLVSHQKI